MSHSTPSEKYYAVLITPEHQPTATPEKMCLCEHHYLMAASCLMIRRVLDVDQSRFNLCHFCK